MSNLAEVITPDLGKARGLSQATLDLFRVSLNGTGWLWETKTLTGGTAMRWKSYYSQRDSAPENERQTWKKYAWYPERPLGADYFCAPSISLADEIESAFGVEWLVGGEIAVMTMIEVGKRNSTCFFGDTNIPDTLVEDLKASKTTWVNMIPDRDEAGQKCAFEVRDRLRDSGIELYVFALPYPVTAKHGKDVSDFWRDCEFNKERFLARLRDLELWELPEREEESPRLFPDAHLIIADNELPSDYIRDIERAQEVYPAFNSDGWSRRPCHCPFHDDEHASAYWNRDKKILKCFVCAPPGRSYYLANEVAKQHGIELSSYTRVPLTVAPALKVLPKPTEMVKKTTKPEAQSLRPPLTVEAQLTESQIEASQQGRRWLDNYTAWAKVGTLYVPDSFHEACALWLLSTIATRRMKFNNGVDIYPNLYVMIVAATTRYHKSTAFKQINRVLQKANLEPLMLPVDVTPEALFDELAGIQPSNFNSLCEEDRNNWLIGRAVAAQRSIFKDEASSILANLRKEYNAGLTELLLQGYDGDGGKLKKLLKGKGLTMVKDMCLSFLGATTPIMWGKYIGAEEHENGFAARFAVITPDGSPEYCFPGFSAPVPDDMLVSLRRMYIDILPWHGGKKPSASQTLGDLITPPVMNVMATQEAHHQLNLYLKALTHDLLDRYSLDDAKAACYGRLATMAFKIAMLLAAIHTESGMVRIEECHAYAAQLICERWRESLHRLERDIARASGSLEEKVLVYLRTSGEGGASLRDIMRDCAIKERQRAVNTLEVIAEDGQIEKYQLTRNGPGRPSIRYKVVGVEGK